MNILNTAIASGTCNVVALCDVDQKQLDAAVSTVKESTGKVPKIYKDYRELLEKEKPDIAIVATPDHWHALPAIKALEMDCHVYLEKPMSHTIEQAVNLRDTIKSTGVTFQLGHQNRQQMSFKMAKELYEKGVLGDVSMVQTYTNRNTIFGAWIRDVHFTPRADMLGVAIKVCFVPISDMDGD